MSLFFSSPIFLYFFLTFACILIKTFFTVCFIKNGYVTLIVLRKSSPLASLQYKYCSSFLSTLFILCFSTKPCVSPGVKKEAYYQRLAEEMDHCVNLCFQQLGNRKLKKQAIKFTIYYKILSYRNTTSCTNII